MNRLTAPQLVLCSQVAFFGFLAVCTVLLPHYLFERNEGGASNFGVHARTIVPYSLALGLGGCLLFAAGIRMPNHARRQRQVGRVLHVLGVLLLFALATTYPYKLNQFFDILHSVSFQILFLAQFMTGVWLACFVYKSAFGLALFGLQLLGFVFGLLTLVDLLHILFIAQMLSGLSFGFLLVSSVRSQVTV